MCYYPCTYLEILAKSPLIINIKDLPFVERSEEVLTQKAKYVTLKLCSCVIRFLLLSVIYWVGFSTSLALNTPFQIPGTLLREWFWVEPLPYPFSLWYIIPSHFRQSLFLQPLYIIQYRQRRVAVWSLFLGAAWYCCILPRNGTLVPLRIPFLDWWVWVVFFSWQCSLSHHRFFFLFNFTLGIAVLLLVQNLVLRWKYHDDGKPVPKTEETAKPQPALP